ncbi:hypothetical protein [Yersinia aleksiciae]|nr:hypothetical protein [Yersinia aleksiciae]MDA5498171.1 hypothetical protein [Yersinia aleksiciae]WQC70424.1 hypothetical protein N0K21_17655 [Yersinia aleksiciae]
MAAPDDAPPEKLPEELPKLTTSPVELLKNGVIELIAPIAYNVKS